MFSTSCADSMSLKAQSSWNGSDTHSLRKVYKTTSTSLFKTIRPFSPKLQLFTTFFMP